MNKFQILQFVISCFFIVACSTDDNLTDPDTNFEIPEISQEVINPKYVDVVNSRLLYFSDNEYAFEITDETKKIGKGSVVVADCEGEHRIIVVESVDYSVSSISVRARRGDLCDIFANTTLHLSSKNAVDTRSDNVGCTLSKVEIQDNTGQFHPCQQRTRTQTNITSKLWEWESEDLTEEERTIYKSENSKLWFSEASASLDLDINLTLSFGGRDAVQEAYEQFRSNELEIRGVLIGSFSAVSTLSAEFFGSALYQEEDDELVVHNVVRPIRLTFTTPSGIPVQAVLNADLRRGANLKAEGNIKASFGAKLKASLENGFEWKQISGMNPVSSATFEPEFIPPAIEGYGSVTGKTWLYPRVFVTLYDVLGPSFDIIPYIGAELSGGFKSSYQNSSDDFLALSLRCYAGIDFDAGFSLKRMNYETFRKSLGRFNVLESNIYESPSRLETLSGLDLIPKVGVPITYTIGVLDYCPWLQKEQLTPLPQIVAIETSDLGSKSYELVVNGELDVTWIPKDEDDFMQVSLYTPEGNVLDRLIFNVGEMVNNGYFDNSSYNGPIQILSCRYIGTYDDDDEFNFEHEDVYIIKFRLKDYPYYCISDYFWTQNIKAVGYGGGIALISSPDNKNVTDVGGSIHCSDSKKTLPDGIYEIAFHFDHYGFDYSGYPTPYFWFWLLNPREENFSYMSNKAIKVTYDGKHFREISGGELPREIIDDIINR